jgi:hypothetical protein
MTIRDDIAAAIAANAGIMAVLTGGVHKDIISRQTTPSAFDATTLELKPCAVVRMETEVPDGPFVHSVRTPVAIYFYQRTGYDAIEAAMQLVYALLQRSKVGAATFEVRFADQVNDQWDDTLNASMAMQRYNVTRMRA